MTKQMVPSAIQTCKLPEVFEYLGLSKYTSVFTKQEVRFNEISKFQTLLTIEDFMAKKIIGVR